VFRVWGLGVFIRSSVVGICVSVSTIPETLSAKPYTLYLIPFTQEVAVIMRGFLLLLVVVVVVLLLLLLLMERCACARRVRVRDAGAEELKR